MTLFEQSLVLADALGVAGFALAFLLFWRFKFEIRNVLVFFLVWAAISLFEYYFLGPNSYIAMDDEGDHFIPYYMYLINHHLGGQFGHHVAGGNDIYAAFSPSIQLVSPELLWLKYFPTWIAILIHKFFIVAVGFWGSYLLCRETTKANVMVCAAAGAIFTFSSHKLVGVTYSIGSSLAFLPLAIYVFVARSESQNYWRFTVPVAIIIGIYLDITHSIELMYAGVGLSALLFKRINFRVLGALVVLFIAMLINWAEPIYAMIQFAPLTDRGGNFDTKPINLARIIEVIEVAFIKASENRIIWLAFASAAVLHVCRDEMRQRAIFILVLLLVLYPILLVFPFANIGMAPLEKISHHYSLLAFCGITVPLMARAAHALSLKPSRAFLQNAQVSGGLLMAIAIGMLIHFKVYNFSNMLYHGGQSQYHSISNLPSFDWRKESPMRVVTLRVRDLGPEPGLAYGMYGLEALDVYQMLETKQRSIYYEVGIFGSNPSGGGVDPRLFIDWSQWRDGEYHGIEQQLSLPHLRLVNVGYILSPIPLAKNAQLELVSGPDSRPITKFDRSDKIQEYIKDRISRLFDYPEVYIYAINTPYPQVFAASKVSSIADDTNDIDFISLLRSKANNTELHATIRENWLDDLGQANDSLHINSFRKVRDGYEISTVAPEGGIVVVNTVHLPYWKATADGMPLKIVPTNYLQMGVQVPANTRQVKFEYHRPDIKDLLAKLFSN